jgi:hypothetical protein
VSEKAAAMDTAGNGSDKSKKTLRKTIRLLEFYSSQADLLYAQYQNINQLLGPTSDWSHPGTHCEILLRDFLRRYMVRGLSVDKGYVFGRVANGQKDRHGPEIDILIHDAFAYPPVFRVDDFVIVQPESVRGIIQVKRALESRARHGDQVTDSFLYKGIAQAVDAKQHLLDVLLMECRKEPWAKWPGCPREKVMQVGRVFSAVVGFEDKTDQAQETYRQAILHSYNRHHEIRSFGSETDTGVAVLPNFVGGIMNGVCLASGTSNVNMREYGCFEATVKERRKHYNIGLQLFLAYLFHALKWGDLGPASQPPFDLPNGIARGILKVPSEGEQRSSKPKESPP